MAPRACVRACACARVRVCLCTRAGAPSRTVRPAGFRCLRSTASQSNRSTISEAPRAQVKIEVHRYAAQVRRNAAHRLPLGVAAHPCCPRGSRTAPRQQAPPAIASDRRNKRARRLNSSPAAVRSNCSAMPRRLVLPRYYIDVRRCRAPRLAYIQPPGARNSNIGDRQNREDSRQYTRVQRESGGAGVPQTPCIWPQTSSLKTVFNSDEPTLFAEIRLENIRSLVPLRRTHYGSARTAP